MTTNAPPQSRPQSSARSATGLHTDSGLISLLILARFYDLPAD
jgi:hypothetical protein